MYYSANFISELIHSLSECYLDEILKKGVIFWVQHFQRTTKKGNTPMKQISFIPFHGVSFVDK